MNQHALLTSNQGDGIEKEYRLLVLGTAALVLELWQSKLKSSRRYGKVREVCKVKVKVMGMVSSTTLV